MDESSKQLISELRVPIASAPRRPKLVDDESIRNGVAEIFMEIELLAGRRHVAIMEHRTRIDWANFIKGMLEERYPTAKKVVLVMDKLNTHSVASLYQAFSPEVAQRLADKIPALELMVATTAAWERDRNNRSAKVKWQFSTDDARMKLRRLYPAF
jgi:hypothetical protein